MIETWESLQQPIRKQMRAGSNRLYQFDVGALIVPPWQANMGIAIGGTVRPTQRNSTGFWYQNDGASAAQTGDSEPGWGSVLGGQTPDGSLIWTAVAPPGTGQDSVASVIFSQVNPPDDDLTITPIAPSQRIASAYFGATTSGSVYVVNIEITMTSTQVFVPQLILSVL